jgi:hypothetical protein
VVQFALRVRVRRGGGGKEREGAEAVSTLGAAPPRGFDSPIHNNTWTATKKDKAAAVAAATVGRDRRGRARAPRILQYRQLAKHSSAACMHYLSRSIVVRLACPREGKATFAVVVISDVKIQHGNFFHHFTTHFIVQPLPPNPISPSHPSHHQVRRTQQMPHDTRHGFLLLTCRLPACSLVCILPYQTQCRLGEIIITSTTTSS